MLVDSLLTKLSIASLSGSSIAVFVLTNTLGKVFSLKNKIRRKVGFVFSLILSFILYFNSYSWDLLGIIIAIVNACLIFCTTVGVVQISDKTLSKKTKNKSRKFSSDNSISSKNSLSSFLLSWY
jgi:hypothetical protein